MGLLAAAGCTSSPGSTGKTPAAATDRTPTVTGTDAFRFTPSRITVPAGDVTLRLLASGSYPHNISVPSLHLTSATVGTAPGSPRTAELRLHDLRPGTYRFVCTFHSQAGMTGELVVK